MEKTFKCSNGHKFQSSDDSPMCPTCSEPGKKVVWEKITSFIKKKNSTDKKIRKKAVKFAVVSGLFSIGSGSSSTDGEGNAGADVEGKGGTFGGGGVSGSF